MNDPNGEETGFSLINSVWMEDDRFTEFYDLTVGITGKFAIINFVIILNILSELQESR